MSKFNHFVGIDMSKEFFDAVLIGENIEKPEHQQFNNNISGCKKLLKWLLSFKIDLGQTLVCCEHTGMYINILTAFLLNKDVPLWVEMSYRIIKSSGLQRGKTDKVDAHRIAVYAMKYQENAILFKPRKEVLNQIACLLSLRNKLVKTRAHLSRSQNEYKAFDKNASKLIGKYQVNTLNGIEEDLEEIEKELNNLISSDLEIKTKFTQITSVPGIGKVTALMLLVFTNEFKNFKDPRQLACYCGVVPFEYASGKSIKGRPRVHHMANKKLKTALHMCAITASKNDSELHAYFTRKVEEGKSKMLVINNIRNKLIHRVCACVRHDRNFEKRNAA
jgi:transposase